MHKENLDDITQILEGGKEKMKQEENKQKEKEGKLKEKEDKLKEKERLLDAKTNFPAAEVTILNLALSELNREAVWYKKTAVSEVMLEKIRRGEKIPNLPKGLESYQDVCSRLRGIGHVPTAVEESIQWKTLFNKHEIALLEIKRLESVVKLFEERIESITMSIRKEHAHKPSTPALVGRPRTEPPISAEEERKRKRNKQSSLRKSKGLRQKMNDFHSTPTS